MEKFTINTCKNQLYTKTPNRTNTTDTLQTTVQYKYYAKIRIVTVLYVFGAKHIFVDVFHTEHHDVDFQQYIRLVCTRYAVPPCGLPVLIDYHAATGVLVRMANGWPVKRRGISPRQIKNNNNITNTAGDE